jgi:hypothetical protein
VASRWGVNFAPPAALSARHPPLAGRDNKGACVSIAAMRFSIRGLRLSPLVLRDGPSALLRMREGMARRKAQILMARVSGGDTQAPLGAPHAHQQGSGSACYLRRFNGAGPRFPVRESNGHPSRQPAPGRDSYWSRAEPRRRPSVWLRTKPAGAAPRPASRTPHDAPLSGRGECSVS